MELNSSSQDTIRVSAEPNQTKPQPEQQNDEITLESNNSEEESAEEETETPRGGEVYESLLSEFEEFVANERNGAMVGTTRALRFGLEVGDIVWGKVKSHPWWPGHIFNEAFASSSVRRTRREGYVLVAFFGDSSYGWFDPAELIPFELNFDEKSLQTSSRNFVKAVEEAVDEVSRRHALGLACRCRNPYNFRPSTVDGYFAVDVPDYEAGGVYSVSQIKKARDEFKPIDILGFVKQLAVAPGGSDKDFKSIEFVKNKANAFAYRKVVFEEFDETYAQAFGVQSSKSSGDKASALDHPVKEPTRAPLSGPLVIAEALGGGKSKKPAKVKGHSKKDKYLFKRRDEPTDSEKLQTGQIQASSSVQAAYVEGSVEAAGGSYVLQKRAPVLQDSVKHEQSEFIKKEKAGPVEGATIDAKPFHVKEIDAVQETKENVSVVGLKGAVILDLTSSHHDNGGEYEDSAKMEKADEVSDEPEFEVAARAEANDGQPKLRDMLPCSVISPLDAKRSTKMSADGGVKVAKVRKRPLGDSSTDKSALGEKKKKKKRDSDSEITPGRPKKLLPTGKVEIVGNNISAKKTQSGMTTPKEESRVNSQKKNMGTSNSLFNYIRMLPIDRMGDIVLSPLVSDLRALALNPTHVAERNNSSTALQFFLLFRNRVYQKSLSLSSPFEADPAEIRATKSASSVRPSDSSTCDNVKVLKPSKPAKSVIPPDDPAKTGRKRLPSDRQEEIAAKRLQKMTQIKLLATEKKPGQRYSEAQPSEGKDPVIVAQPKLAKLVSAKKMESPAARIVDPTMLVMKFPPGTSLPSHTQLKAKFARFGLMDLSATRVFWKSSQCRVVFRYKQDAQAAFKYAAANKSFFGNLEVRYSLRDPAATATEGVEVKDPIADRLVPPLAPLPLPQPTGQLKSILKKPVGGDEAGAGGNGGGRGMRVKFMLGEEDSTREDQMVLVGNRSNYNNNANFGDVGGVATTTTTTTSVAMDFNSKNFHKANISSPSTLPPLLPLPPQFSKPAHNNSHHAEIQSRNSIPNLTVTDAVAPMKDISQQMLSLLTRCNDVVTNVTGFLGYVPYHPL